MNKFLLRIIQYVASKLYISIKHKTIFFWILRAKIQYLYFCIKYHQIKSKSDNLNLKYMILILIVLKPSRF